MRTMRLRPLAVLTLAGAVLGACTNGGKGKTGHEGGAAADQSGAAGAADSTGSTLGPATTGTTAAPVTNPATPAAADSTRHDTTHKH